MIKFLTKRQYFNKSGFGYDFYHNSVLTDSLKNIDWILQTEHKLSLHFSTVADYRITTPGRKVAPCEHF